MEQLPPLPFAVGVNQQFCNHPTVALRMRAGLFTHPESYTVTDGYNNPIISCALQATKSGTVGGMTYNVYSMTQRKGASHMHVCGGAGLSARAEIRDGHGNLLFILANEYMHLHQTFVGKHPQTDENIFQIQKAAFSFHGEKKWCAPPVRLPCPCAMLTAWQQVHERSDGPGGRASDPRELPAA
jgi:hypothetical protein